MRVAVGVHDACFVCCFIMAEGIHQAAVRAVKLGFDTGVLLIFEVVEQLAVFSVDGVAAASLGAVVMADQTVFEVVCPFFDDAAVFI